MKDIYFKKFFKLYNTHNKEALIKLRAQVKYTINYMLSLHSIEDMQTFQRWEYQDMLQLLNFIEDEIIEIEKVKKNKSIEKNIEKCI